MWGLIIHTPPLCTWAPRFSTNRADVTSIEIRIRKLEYNLSKLIAFKQKKAAEAEAALKRKAEAAARAAAEFARVADTNDGEPPAP